MRRCDLNEESKRKIVGVNRQIEWSSKLTQCCKIAGCSVIILQFCV